MDHITNCKDARGRCFEFVIYLNAAAIIKTHACFFKVKSLCVRSAANSNEDNIGFEGFSLAAFSWLNGKVDAFFVSFSCCDF